MIDFKLKVVTFLRGSRYRSMRETGFLDTILWPGTDAFSPKSTINSNQAANFKTVAYASKWIYPPRLPTPSCQQFRNDLGPFDPCQLLVKTLKFD